MWATAALVLAASELRAQEPRPARDSARADSLRRDSLSRAVNLATVVVTGTVTPTALKAVPVTMSIVTAPQIRERGITTIDQLFRGEVPGIFVPLQSTAREFGEAYAFARGSTSLESFDGRGPKVYVDGVEMAQEAFFNAVDPTTIDRIEILPGPQAAAIYGSGAIGGVINIQLKKGQLMRRPTVRGDFSAGMIQTFSGGGAPRQDHSIGLDGGDDRLSYNVSGAFSGTGEWRPGIASRQGGGSVGLRYLRGWLVADASFRLNERRTVGFNAGNRGGPVAELREAGELTYSVSDLIPFARVSTLGTRTASLALSGSPREWWEQRLVIGEDASDEQTHPTAPTFIAPSESLYTVVRTLTTKRTVSYNTTVRSAEWRRLRADVTVGGDLRAANRSGYSAQSGVPSGTLRTRTAPTITLDDATDRGAFGQLQVGFADAAFLTAALRAERNPNYGPDYGTNYAPRLGLAYTAPAIAGVVAKARAAYGRATRPPSAFARSGSPFVADPLYGVVQGTLPNTAIGPSVQRGFEYGLDLFAARWATLHVTRYDQTVEGVIVSYVADSVQSLVVDPFSGQFTYLRQSQFANLGDVKNRGWELQGTARVRAFELGGAYTWARSRVAAVDPRYEGIARPGDLFPGLPERNGSVSLRYRSGRVNAGVVANGIGSSLMDQFGSEAWFRCTQSRLPVTSDRICSGVTRAQRFAEGYWDADADVSFALTPTLTPFLRVKNLGNTTRNERSFALPVMGRITTLGVRLR